MLDMMSDHMELHDQEDDNASVSCAPTPPQHQTQQPITKYFTSKSSSKHERLTTSPGDKSSRSSWKRRLLTSALPGPHLRLRPSHRSSNTQVHPGKRLGTAHLGKYANETRMPPSLEHLLRTKGQVSQAGIIPVLEQLLLQSSSTKSAYLCHPAVQHVSRLRKEGPFCGYRNIQSLCSYIVATKAEGWERVGCEKGLLPSVFDIQEWIEAAWDKGINAECRAETGGVRGTRKYIGTYEAEAMFRFLGVPCQIKGFKLKERGRSEEAMLDEVEGYFLAATERGQGGKVKMTGRPPIYFQHQGHSMTIVGLEKTGRGERNLLVFDPMFSDPYHVRRLVGGDFKGEKMVGAWVEVLLKAYRRGNKYLGKFNAFEVLK